MSNDDFPVQGYELMAFDYRAATRYSILVNGVEVLYYHNAFAHKNYLEIDRGNKCYTVTGEN